MTERIPVPINDNEPPSALEVFRRKYPPVESPSPLTEDNLLDRIIDLADTYSFGELSPEAAREHHRLKLHYAQSPTSLLIEFINESLEQLAAANDDATKAEVELRLTAAVSQLQERVFGDVVR